jgi:hypothetical protein
MIDERFKYVFAVTATKLSNQLSCGEREKTFKALIDHDLA